MAFYLLKRHDCNLNILAIRILLELVENNWYRRNRNSTCLYYLFISYFRKRGRDRTRRWQTREAKATSDAFHTSPTQRIGKVFRQNSLSGHLPEGGNSCENRSHGKSRSGRCGQTVQAAVGTKRLIQREIKPIAWLRVLIILPESRCENFYRAY